MSGIAAILNVDGRPAEPADLVRMTDAIAHRGPDGTGHWFDGTVGLGHVVFHTTPESHLDEQPLADETRGLCLTLDGRIDNRKELRACLEERGAELRSDSDAELVLRAYQRWGESCAEHILGDWAFIIWDKPNRRLFMARDPLGIRQLLYWFDGDLLLVASEPTAIFEHRGCLSPSFSLALETAIS